MRVTEESMWHGLAAARLGGRLTDISHAVETYARSQGDYGIVEEYGGHGIGTEMHQEPHLLNYGRPGRGPTLRKGLALAVEPMLTTGSRHTRELDDGWTVSTVDGGARGALRAHVRGHRARTLGPDRARRRCRAPGRARRHCGVLGR